LVSSLYIRYNKDNNLYILYRLIDTDIKKYTNLKTNIHTFFEILRLITNITIETTQNDTPEPWGVFFQDNATPQMEGLEELHNNIMFYLAIILFAVS